MTSSGGARERGPRAGPRPATAGPAGLAAGPGPARPGGRAGAGGRHRRRDASPRAGASRRTGPGSANSGSTWSMPTIRPSAPGRRGPRDSLRAGGAQHVRLAGRARDRRLPRGRCRHGRVHLRLGRGGAVLRPPDGAVGGQDDRRPQRRGPPPARRGAIAAVRSGSATSWGSPPTTSSSSTWPRSTRPRRRTSCCGRWPAWSRIGPGRAPGDRRDRRAMPPMSGSSAAASSSSGWSGRVILAGQRTTSGGSTGWPTRSSSPRSGRAGAWR